MPLTAACPRPAVVTNQEWNAGDDDDRSDKHPERQDEVQDDADRDDGDQPRKPVTPGETAFHVVAIDRLRGVS